MAILHDFQGENGFLSFLQLQLKNRKKLLRFWDAREKRNSILWHLAGPAPVSVTPLSSPNMTIAGKSPIFQ